MLAEDDRRIHLKPPADPHHAPHAAREAAGRCGERRVTCGAATDGHLRWPAAGCSRLVCRYVDADSGGERGDGARPVNRVRAVVVPASAHEQSRDERRAGMDAWARMVAGARCSVQEQRSAGKERAHWRACCAGR